MSFGCWEDVIGHPNFIVRWTLSEIGEPSLFVADLLFFFLILDEKQGADGVTSGIH